jgi:glycosyltransferase involved in cell wall biosynthesis
VRVVVVSGMWPPDVGGPATHAPETCEFLLSRGHDVTAVTMADRAPESGPYRVSWVSRRLPLGIRHVAAALLVGRLARGADVVYSTGMVGRTSLGAAAVNAPLVLKLTSDPVFERALRWRLAGPDLTRFQRDRGVAIGALRHARNLALGRASRLVVPSRALGDLAVSWGVPAAKIALVRNPVAPPALEPRAELRRRHGFTGRTLAYAGRLVPQKALEDALEAVRRHDRLSLVLAGDGPHRDRLERLARRLGLEERARFLGPRPRATVFELLRAADAALLSSAWENFPHMAVEALAVGTPVIATDAGGVTEIVSDGWNGLVVPTRDVDRLTAAIGRYLADARLEERLRARAAASVAEFSPEATYPRLEAILLEAAANR